MNPIHRFHNWLSESSAEDEKRMQSFYDGCENFGEAIAPTFFWGGLGILIVLGLLRLFG